MVSRIVVGITTNTTIPSRQPIITVISTTIDTVAKRQVEQQLVGLLVGGLAVVAGHHHVQVVGHQPLLDPLQPVQDLLGDHHGVGPGALGDGDRDRRHGLVSARRVLRPEILEVPGAVVRRLRPDHHVRHVADIDRAAVARADQKQADIRHALQRLAGHRDQGVAVLPQPSDPERAVGVLDLVDQLVERDAVRARGAQDPARCGSGRAGRRRCRYSRPRRPCGARAAVPRRC